MRLRRVSARAVRFAAVSAASLLTLMACRIRREVPNRASTNNPAAEASVRPGGEAETSASGSAAVVPDASAEHPSGDLVDEPASAPRGVYVVAATSATTSAATLRIVLNVVRHATQRLLDGNSIDVAAVESMHLFERSVDIPVAHGAPLRAAGKRPECDAVLLDSGGLLSGVGAASDIESPSRLSREIHRRGWGLLVGPGAARLAEETGIPGQLWQPDESRSPASQGDAGAPDAGVARDSGGAVGDAGVFAPRVTLDAGQGAIDSPKDEPASATQSRRNDENAVRERPADGVARPSAAVVVLRDRDGHYLIAAEDCGVPNAPVGQLTAVAATSASAFVGREGAVFVLGRRETLLRELSAEKIYRQLATLQASRAAAEWGLREIPDSGLVVVVSRSGASVVSNPPMAWAINRFEGEASASHVENSTARLATSTIDGRTNAPPLEAEVSDRRTAVEAVAPRPAATTRIGFESVSAPEPPATEDPATRPAGGRVASSPRAIAMPKRPIESANLAPAAPERDAGAK